MTSWTNHDRVAFNEWANTDLGQKALRFIEEGRPNFDDSLDLNHMAMMGAVLKGYETAIKRLESMRHVTGGGIVQPRPYVADTDKD
jgi:hypothetical protein